MDGLKLYIFPLYLLRHIYNELKKTLSINLSWWELLCILDWHIDFSYVQQTYLQSELWHEYIKLNALPVSACAWIFLKCNISSHLCGTAATESWNIQESPWNQCVSELNWQLCSLCSRSVCILVVGWWSIQSCVEVISQARPLGGAKCWLPMNLTIPFQPANSILIPIIKKSY